jgi:hypothetical protein
VVSTLALQLDVALGMAISANKLSRYSIDHTKIRYDILTPFNFQLILDLFIYGVHVLPLHWSLYTADLFLRGSGVNDIHDGGLLGSYSPALVAATAEWRDCHI